MTKLIVVGLMTSLLMVSGCTLGPDYVAPSIPEHAEEAWKGLDSSLTSPTEIQTAWWKTFNEPLLDAFIEQAAVHNHDVRVALANVAQARALRQESGGGLWPSLSGSTSAQKEGLSQQTTRNSNASGQRERDNFDASLDARWELDLFGGIKRDIEASDAALQAAEENRRDVLMSLFAEVARNYFEVRGLQKRLAVTERNIELLREVETLAETQLESGTVSEFDVARARGEREAVEATLPNLQALMQAGIYRLSVLTGQPPKTHMETLQAQAPMPTPPDMVPVGLQSDILRRRPDIRKAERELAGATAEIGVATADLFPRFALTGSLGSSARMFSDLFSQGAVTYALGQTINWSLFEGGALRARIEAAKANAAGSLAAYEKAVLVALEDAEGSLTRYGKEWQTLKRLQAAEATRKEAFNIARLRYEEGEENFLVILDAERSLVSIQDDVIQSEVRILTSLTQLYKSLGGGWEVFEDAPPAS